MNLGNVWVCDIETNTKEEDVSMWLVGGINMATDEYVHFDNWFDFLITVGKTGNVGKNKDGMKSVKLIFHNLKFDGTYLIYWLLGHNFTYSKLPRLKEEEFSTIITNLGQWYQIKFIFEGVIYTVEDSLKLIPFSVKDMSEAFNIPFKKSEINYNVMRSVPYTPTQQEIYYHRMDCKVVCEVLKIFYKEGVNKMTLASSAISIFESMIGKKKHTALFPTLTLEEDRFIRKSYMGGVVLVNENYKGRVVGNGRVYDINSSYPWAMKYKELPYGVPKFFEGEYKKNKLYPLFVQHIRVMFEIKKDGIPWLSIHGNPLFCSTDKLKSSNNEIVDLWLTSIDLVHFLKNYETLYCEYIDGYMFKSKVGIFSSYVDHYYTIKKEAKGAKRQIAKLMMNSLSGKYASKVEGVLKGFVHLSESDNILKFIEYKEEKKGFYVAVTAFITAWGRDNLLNAIYANSADFLYCDTDSVHLLGNRAHGFSVGKELGEWDNEFIFLKAKYVRAKTYIEFGYDGRKKKTLVKCAGMPSLVKDKVNFDNFYTGAKFEGKLMFKNVAGGVLLKPVPFEIKE